MRLCPTALLLPLLVLAPGLAMALALGDIELNSALNEPFDAEITIVSATPAELENLTVQVAPRETFERYGLDRPDFLSGFTFTVDRGAGRNVLRVRSRQPVAEPFVTFLVEAQWRRGRLLREYTVLLDPPVFVPGQERAAAPAPVVAPRSAVAQPSPSAGVIERPRPPARPATRGSTTAAGPVSFGASYGPIRRGETLWNIAERLRGGTSLTTNQVMIAIYRANPEAFLGNINLVKEGSSLRIPARATIDSVAQQDAFATAVAHNQAWRAGTPSQVPAVAAAPARAPSPPRPEPSRLRLVEPETTTSGTVAGTTGAAAGADAATRATLARNEAEIERLADENDRLRADLEEIRRLISVKDSELANLQRQVSERAAVPPPTVAPAPTAVPGTDLELDTTVTTPAEPVAGVDEVTDEPLVVDDATVAEAPAASPIAIDEPDAATTAAGNDTTVAGAPDASAVTPGATLETPGPDVSTTPEPAAEPVAGTPPPPVVTASLPEEPSFFDKVLSTLIGLATSLWLWIALGLAALAAFVMFALRGRGADEPDALDALTDETRIIERLPADKHAVAAGGDEEVEFFEDSGTFKPVDFAAAQASGDKADYPFEDTVGTAAEIKLDQTDPLAEADFHMAYGLYDQAADLVRKAVAREPDRVDLRMKLLEIFFVWGNQDEFRATAQELRDTMGAQVEWDKIVIMGKQICPDDELFAGDAGIGSGADIDLEFDSGERQVADADAPATDLDLAFGEDAESVDLGFGEEPSVPSGDDATGVQLTPDVEAPFASPRPGSEDVTVESTALASDEGDDALDFDLGLEFAAAEPEPEPEPEPDSGEVLREQIRSKLSSTDTDETAEMDLADLGVDLDLGTGPSPALDQGAAASFDDVFEQETDATSEMPAPTAELTAGAPGLDLDIGTLFDGTAGDDDTSRDLQSLDDAMADTADSGHFSAEIETLHGDALDVDISSFGDASHDETKLIASDEPTGAPVEEAFSVSVFGDAAEAGGAAASADETRLIGPDDTVLSADDDFSASVFGQSDDETVLTEGLGQGDGLATDMFNFDGDDGEGGAVDLDLGDAMDDDADGDRTTVKVATADLALPDGGDELGEVGTKLDLARAYMDMGDPDGARGILEEVLSEGNESQQADARQMLESLS